MTPNPSRSQRLIAFCGAFAVTLSILAGVATMATETAAPSIAKAAVAPRA